MKQRGLVVLAALLVVSLSALVQRCSASVSACAASPRIIGAFGAENGPARPISLRAEIRAQLPSVHAIRQVLDTKLAPAGEQLVIYDSSASNSDPHPKVAIVVGGRVVKLFDARDLAPQGVGCERYLSSCEFEFVSNEKALAVALSTACDGTGSAFAIVKLESGEYRLVFSPLVSQGRMELDIFKIKLWDRSLGKNAARPDSVDFECEWCNHRYVVTEYAWRNGEYVKGVSQRTTRAYDPAEISGTPLVIRRFNKQDRPAKR